MRERGRETVWNSNRQEEGWTYVTYRKPPRREVGVHQHPHLNRPVRSSRKEGGFTIFVDNLPRFYDNALLRKLFCNLGRLTDVYSPWRRRTITDTKYGFVSFAIEGDADLAISKMDGLTVFKHKLKVEKAYIARNRGEGYSKVKLSKNEDDGRKDQGKNGKGKGVRSYAEVVKKQSKVWVQKSMSSENEVKKKMVAHETEGFVPLALFENRVERFQEIQKAQDKKLEDLILMCMALKHEMDLRLARNVDNAEKTCSNGEKEGVSRRGRFEEVSKVPDSVNEEYSGLVGEDDVHEFSETKVVREEEVECSESGEEEVPAGKFEGNFCRVSGVGKKKKHKRGGNK